MKGPNNISDQLPTYAKNTADTILQIASQFDLKFDEAAKVVHIAAISQLNDTLYHAEHILDEITDAISFEPYD